MHFINNFQGRGQEWGGKMLHPPQKAAALYSQRKGSYNRPEAKTSLDYRSLNFPSFFKHTIGLFRQRWQGDTFAPPPPPSPS